MLFGVEKYFRKETKIDRAGFKSEAQLSFENSQLDKFFLSYHFNSGFKDEPGLKAFLGKALGYRIDETISFLEEVENLSKYISFAEEIIGTDIACSFAPSILTGDIKIIPFTLFPLIQNALHYGYHSNDKYPVRIRIRLIDSTVVLEVSNHVNPYIVSQAETEIVCWFRSRMAYQYPNQFDMFMNSNSNTFKATLRVQLAAL